jgi:hypothetical protein
MPEHLGNDKSGVKVQKSLTASLAQFEASSQIGQVQLLSQIEEIHLNTHTIDMVPCPSLDHNQMSV